MAACFIDPGEIDVIAPNFKRRLSGVTSTIIQLVPAQARLGARIAVVGPGLPAGLPRLRLRDLWRLWQRPRGGGVRIWHARRNTEMLPGVIMRDLLRMPLKLVFTSAAQRHHKGFTRFLIGRMDRVIATGSGSARYLKVPHTVIMHGIDTAKFRPAADKPAARRAVDLPGAVSDRTRLIGCFGRVRHQKGTDLFVEAMIALLPAHPDWMAVIAGRVTSEHAGFAAGLREKIAGAGLGDRIVLLGEVPDILPWYRAIDLYVAPSRNEGFGLTPLEAMACGVPAVATTAGAYADMIVPGVNGEICATDDGAGLTAAIARVLERGQAIAELGAGALETVRSRFAIEVEAEAVNAVYAGLLRQH
ncbi:glycosyltransferase family 4 protein [Hoeflea marina]|nr:glycosyltransferase family 4 protein [Hoeflea marina]